MSGHPGKIAEHCRELAAEEVALAKAAVTNEARAKHYATGHAGCLPSR